MAAPLPSDTTAPGAGFPPRKLLNPNHDPSRGKRQRLPTACAAPEAGGPGRSTARAALRGAARRQSRPGPGRAAAGRPGGAGGGAVPARPGPRARPAPLPSPRPRTQSRRGRALLPLPRPPRRSPALRRAPPGPASACTGRPRPPPRGAQRRPPPPRPAAAAAASSAAAAMSAGPCAWLPVSGWGGARAGEQRRRGGTGPATAPGGSAPAAAGRCRLAGRRRPGPRSPAPRQRGAVRFPSAGAGKAPRGEAAEPRSLPLWRPDAPLSSVACGGPLLQQLSDFLPSNKCELWQIDGDSSYNQTCIILIRKICGFPFRQHYFFQESKLLQALNLVITYFWHPRQEPLGCCK
ncbi:uncharacterized protein LOC142413083 [Mycteria americana]|uniref:uncharacterized protein LOC142413083 n=1 Tax=Mycteria americana TaxID=33587 RepID=UPI003F58C693